MVGAPACGDVMKLQIKVGQDGVIEDAKFKTYGCGSAIASSSLVTEWVKGKTLDQATSIKNTQIAEELALPPVKIHCSILAEDAIKAAVADYRKKHDSESDRPKLPPSRSTRRPTDGSLKTHGDHADRKRGQARRRIPDQARQGRRPAAGRAHDRLLGSRLQARIRRRDSQPRTIASTATASRWSSTRRACRTSTAPSSTSPRGLERGLQVQQPEREG